MSTIVEFHAVAGLVETPRHCDGNETATSTNHHTSAGHDEAPDNHSDRSGNHVYDSILYEPFAINMTYTYTKEEMGPLVW